MEPFRGATSLQDQVNRLFSDVLERKSEESASPLGRLRLTSMRLSTTGRQGRSPGNRSQGSGHPGGEQHLTIRGERKFEKNVSEENYLRVERAYGSFARSFTLANTVNSEAIKADYQNGVLTLSIPSAGSQADRSRSMWVLPQWQWPRLPPAGNSSPRCGGGVD